MFTVFENIFGPACQSHCNSCRGWCEGGQEESRSLIPPWHLLTQCEELLWRATRQLTDAIPYTSQWGREHPVPSLETLPCGLPLWRPSQMLLVTGSRVIPRPSEKWHVSSPSYAALSQTGWLCENCPWQEGCNTYRAAQTVPERCGPHWLWSQSHAGPSGWWHSAEQDLWVVRRRKQGVSGHGHWKISAYTPRPSQDSPICSFLQKVFPDEPGSPDSACPHAMAMACLPQWSILYFIQEIAFPEIPVSLVHVCLSLSGWDWPKKGQGRLQAEDYRYRAAVPGWNPVRLQVFYELHPANAAGGTPGLVDSAELDNSCRVTQVWPLAKSRAG